MFMLVTGANILSVKFIFISLLLVLMVFCLTYFIKRVMLKKYTQELELSKVMLAELQEELNSHNWSMLDKQQDTNKEIFDEYKTIQEMLAECHIMSHHLQGKTMQDYELKEIMTITTYIHDVIENTKEKMDQLKKKMHVDTPHKEVSMPLEHKQEVTQKVENIQEETSMSDFINTNNEQSVFAKGLKIKGDVEVHSPLVVNGEVYGNLISDSDIDLAEEAIVKGNVSAQALRLHQGKIEGDVIVKEKALVGEGTYIKGNVQADELAINGAIEGNVVSSGEVTFSSNATVVGDVVAATIDIEKGAKIIGNMRIGEINSNQPE